FRREISLRESALPGVGRGFDRSQRKFEKSASRGAPRGASGSTGTAIGRTGPRDPQSAGRDQGLSGNSQSEAGCIGRVGERVVQLHLFRSQSPERARRTFFGFCPAIPTRAAFPGFVGASRQSAQESF